jgi:acyl-homoserine-lactone acylase
MLTKPDNPFLRIHGMIAHRTLLRSVGLPRLLPLLLPLLAACAPGLQAPPAAPVAREIATTEILWDTWGVPHIFATDMESLGRAFGWAQAESHGDLILRLYAEARGRSSEYWGEQNLATDRWVRTNGVPQRAQEWYEQQRPAFRGYLDAFAAGINDYAARHPERITDSLEVVLPVTGVDVLAHTQRVLQFEFLAFNQPTIQQARGRGMAGSNAWAIAPQNSASGNALLLMNPHLPWSDFYLFYEAQLTTPQMNAYGTALVGSPLLSMAFNDHLGWAHTVNTINAADLYELTLTAEGYRWDGGSRPFETRTEVLRVRQRDGAFRPDTLRVRHSVHGPVIDERDGRAYALRVTGLDAPFLLEQIWDMLHARNLAQFEAALRRLQLPMFTVMYADRDGRIMHLFNGRVPVRAQGDWAYWSRPVRGDTSATLWTRVHDYADLPRVVDPPSGWLQNANDPPWTTTVPLALNPDAFPPYMAPRGMGFRPQRSARMLMENEQISLEQMIRLKHSTRMELADRILDDLIAAARRSGNHAASDAAEVLARWDRSADSDSRGAVLFADFVDELGRRFRPLSSAFAVAWQPTQPLSTPRGLADPAGAVAALEAAARRVQERYGSLDVPWGEVYRLRRDNVDLPGNGGSGALGIFRVTEYAPARDNRFVAYNGDTFVAAIEFSNPVRAFAITAYGNATQPGSPHRTDQLHLYSRQELRPVWRTRQEILANLRERTVFDGATAVTQAPRPE